MNLSNIIAHMISEMMEDQDEVEIQRNTLAQTVGCVPSQINYVLASRFTPEHGYIVESRRGGGGYIRITRANYSSPNAVVMHAVNAIGDAIDEKSAKAHVVNLAQASILPVESAKIMLAAMADNCYHGLTPQQRNEVRAAAVEHALGMLLAAADEDSASG